MFILDFFKISPLIISIYSIPSFEDMILLQSSLFILKYSFSFFFFLLYNNYHFIVNYNYFILEYNMRNIHIKSFIYNINILLHKQDIHCFMYVFVLCSDMFLLYIENLVYIFICSKE